MKYIQPFDQPANPDASYQNGNPATGVAGSIWDVRATEHVLRELVHVIEFAHELRPADVGDPMEDDLEQVRKSIVAIVNHYLDSANNGAFVLTADAQANLLFFPHVITNNGLMSLSSVVGKVTLATGQEWVWRGIKRFASGNLNLADREFATVANKTYHLVWYPPGSANAPLPTYPSGRFMLRDLADVAYNPGGAAETNVQFDSDYDKMLIAKVVTNGANTPTITALANRAFLKTWGSVEWNTPPHHDNVTGSQVTIGRYVTTINFARTPISTLRSVTDMGMQTYGTTNPSSEANFGCYTVDRYQVATFNSTTYTLAATGGWTEFDSFC